MDDLLNNGDKNYYEILEISESATQEQIKENYRRLVLIHHPDKSQSDEAAERFREIHQAYQVLGDAEKRLRYDRWGNGYDSGERVIASFVSGFILETFFSCLTPLDTVSKRCKTTTSGVLPTISSLWKTEGWTGLWRGWSVHMLNSYLYGGMKDSLTNNTSNPLGGLLLAQTLSYPFELVGTCIRTRKSDSIFSGFRGVVAKNGLRGLYSGFLPFLCYSSATAYVANWIDTSRYNTWIEIKVRDLLVESKFLGALAVKSAALVAKAAIVALITCPFKMLAVRMQSQSIEQVSSGLVGTVSTIVAQEGLKGLYKGYLYDVLFYSIAEFVPAFLDLARLRQQV